MYNLRYKVPWASELHASHLIPYSVTVYTMWGWIWMNCTAWSNSHCQSMKMEDFLLKELLRIPDSEALWIFRSSVNVGVTIYSSCQSSYKGQELLCACWTGLHNGHMSLTFQMTTFPVGCGYRMLTTAWVFYRIYTDPVEFGCQFGNGCAVSVNCANCFESHRLARMQRR